MPFRDSIRGDKEQLEVQHWPRLFEASVKTDDPPPPFLGTVRGSGRRKDCFCTWVCSIPAPGVAVHSRPSHWLTNTVRRSIRRFHFDMYRIGSEDELYSMGYEGLSRPGHMPLRVEREYPGCPACRARGSAHRKDAAHPGSAHSVGMREGGSHMLIPALDSAALSGSVALCEDGVLIAECTVCTGHTHSETLLPMVEAVLRAAGRQVGGYRTVRLHGRSTAPLPVCASVRLP